MDAYNAIVTCIVLLAAVKVSPEKVNGISWKALVNHFSSFVYQFKQF